MRHLQLTTDPGLRAFHLPFDHLSDKQISFWYSDVYSPTFRHRFRALLLGSLTRAEDASGAQAKEDYERAVKIEMKALWGSISKAEPFT